MLDVAVAGRCLRAWQRIRGRRTASGHRDYGARGLARFIPALRALLSASNNSCLSGNMSKRGSRESTRRDSIIARLHRCMDALIHYCVLSKREEQRTNSRKSLCSSPYPLPM